MEPLLGDVDHTAFAMECATEDRAKINACSKERGGKEDRSREEDRGGRRTAGPLQQHS